MSDNDYENWLVRRRLVSIAAASVTAFYLHCLSIIMSNSESQAQAASTMSQQWTDLEIEAIFQHLISNKSELTDAGNFKKKTYTSAAVAIPGQTKTPSQVQTKWHTVSQSHYHFSN
jgi:hypothetical protein